MQDPSITMLLITFAAMFVAKLYGTIVGGGSFLMQPVLIAQGLPAHIAVAHDVSSSLGNTLGSSVVYHKNKMIRYGIIKWMIPGAIIGPLIGSHLLLTLSDDMIEKILGGLTLASLVYVNFLRKDQGLTEGTRPRHWQIYALAFGLFEGIYIGFCAAGVSLIHSVLMIAIFGTTVIQSVATRSAIYNLSHLMATISYALLGILNWKLYATMFVAAFLAGYTGGHISIRLGNKWLKIILSGTAAALGLWLLLK